MRVFFSIILPLLRPALLTTTILTFIWTFNDFLRQLVYLSDHTRYTAPLGLNAFVDRASGSSYGGMLAMSVVTLVPTVVVFLIVATPPRRGRRDHRHQVDLSTARKGTHVSTPMSRRGFIGLAGGLAATSLAGCGFAPTSGGGSSNNSLTFRWWGGEARNKAYQNAIKLFTEKTGIKVDAQYSGYDGYFNKLNTEFAGGNPPDLFQMDTALVSTYASKGTLTDLSAYIPSTIHLDTLYPAVRSAGAVDGKTYGVPSGSGFAPILYDKTVFEQAKIPVPADNWTWDDFGRVAGELSKAWGRASTVRSTRPRTTPARCSRGCASAARTSTTPRASSPSPRTTWRSGSAFWDGLRKSGAICPPEMLSSTDSATGNHPLIAGQIVMTTGWGLAQMQPLTQHALDIVVVPRGGNGKTGQALSGGVLLSVPVKSKNPEGAAKLIDFFVSDTDAIKAMAMTRGIPPSGKALEALTPSLTASDKRDVTYAQYVADEVAKDGLPPAPTAPPGYNDCKSALDAAAKQVAFGKMSIADAVAQYFRDAEAALAGAK